MAISRAQLLKELLPGLNALFGLEYEKYGEEHKEIYETESSDRSFEEETKLAGFAAAPLKNEGAAIAYDNAQEAFTARYNHVTIALGFSLTEEAVEDKAVDKMIEKVKKQISSMKNANELDKERVNQLSSLDSWEKLKEEFLNFKHTVNVQLGTVGGGGLDPHNINSDFLPSQTNTYNLGSASRRWKDIFLSSNSINLDGATISSDGTGAIAIAASGATLPTGSKTEDGNALAVMGSTTSGSISQPIRRVDFFSAAGGLSTKNATFEFNAEVADKYSFLDNSTFTLENGSALTESGITLFQL